MFTHKITKGECADALAIRIEVFHKEQGFVEEFDDIDKIAHSVVLYKNDKYIATGRIFPTDDESVWKIGRLAVLKEFREHKLGSKVMELVEEIAEENNAKSIKLSAQVHAKGFYEKLGYKAVGEVYIEDDAEHILMKKSI